MCRFSLRIFSRGAEPGAPLLAAADAEAPGACDPAGADELVWVPQAEAIRVTAITPASARAIPTVRFMLAVSSS